MKNASLLLLHRAAVPLPRPHELNWRQRSLTSPPSLRTRAPAWARRDTIRCQAELPARAPKKKMKAKSSSLPNEADTLNRWAGGVPRQAPTAGWGFLQHSAGGAWMGGEERGLSHSYPYRKRYSCDACNDMTAPV